MSSSYSSSLLRALKELLHLHLLPVFLVHWLWLLNLGLFALDAAVDLAGRSVGSHFSGHVGKEGLEVVGITSYGSQQIVKKR